MKRRAGLASLLLGFLSPLTVCAFLSMESSVIFEPVHSKALNTHRSPTAKAIDLVGGLRGGGRGLDGVFSKSGKALITSKLCWAFLSFNGITLLVAPNKLLKDVYNIEPDERGTVHGNFSTYVMRCIGAVSLGVATTVYCAVTKSSIPPLRAIGWGLVPRTVFFLTSLPFLKRAGIKDKRFFIFNAIVTLWCVLSSLLHVGAGNPNNVAKVFSCMAMAKSIFLVARPTMAARTFLGVHIDETNREMEKSRALLRGLGNELMTSAFLMAALAFGTNPSRAAGFTSILWTILLLDMGFFDKTWRLMGSDGPRAQIIHILISSMLAWGFLSS